MAVETVAAEVVGNNFFWPIRKDWPYFEPMKKDLNDIHEWSPKRLRTLRNNLNNRLASFQNGLGGNVKPLQTSHALYGLEEGECKELLKKVQDLLRERDR